MTGGVLANDLEPARPVYFGKSFGDGLVADLQPAGFQGGIRRRRVDNLVLPQ